MCSTRDNAALPALGLPIRESAGHWLFSASPRLIAAVHALHRLLVPRHPPCALTILTVIWPGSTRGRTGPGDTRFSRRLSMAAECGYCAVFKDRGEAVAPAAAAARPVGRATSSGGRRSLKTQQHAGCSLVPARSAPQVVTAR